MSYKQAWQWAAQIPTKCRCETKAADKKREAEQKKATKKVELEAAENSKKVALLPELQEDIKKGVEHISPVSIVLVLSRTYSTTINTTTILTKYLLDIRRQNE